MKKIFNNIGTTLIELVVAIVILGIISVPIFNTLVQTAKINANSDLSIKMKAESEKIIELIKASKGSTTVDSVDYTTGVYYDRLFSPVSSTDPKKYYYLKADKTNVNNIDTSDEYDRWDFKIKIFKNGASTSPLIKVYRNNGDKLYSSIGGKLYVESELTTGTTNIASNMKLNFIGELGSINPYQFKYDIGPYSSTVPFTPGTGKVTFNENTIVIDVDRETDAPTIDIDVNNSTYFDGTSTKYYVVNKVLSYKKNVIVNVFNDDSVSPKVNVTQSSSNITVNRTKASMPQIRNGYKITINITKVGSVNPIMTVPSVVE